MSLFTCFAVEDLNMQKTKKYLSVSLSIIAPIIVFVTLILIATAKDLEIAKAFAKGLDSGEYYTSNFIAKFVEYIGSFPIYIAAYFGTLVLYRKFYDRKDRLKYLSIIFAIGSIGFASLFLMETFKYIFRYDDTEYLLKRFDMLLIYGTFGLLAMVLGIYFYRNIDSKTNDKFLKMTYVIIFSCVFYIMIELIKTPFGRIRFRAMNQIDDFSKNTAVIYIININEFTLYTCFINNNFYINPSFMC